MAALTAICRRNASLKCENASVNALDLVAIDRTDDRFATVYHRLLEPSFPPDQLDSLADLSSSAAKGRADLLVAVEADGTPIGVAVGEWYADSRVQLLAYLAVDPAHRSTGVGGRLLDAAVERWALKHGPCVVVTEIEHPDLPAEHPEWGDPKRRFAFYARHGARVLDLPFFQPALRDSSEREQGMLLVSLHIDQSFQVDHGKVASGPIHEFLTAYFTATEGRVPEDRDGAALLRAARNPDGIALTDLTQADIGELPRIA